MSLTQALNTASSGLKVTQSAMSIVASNVANAQTPGYVRKTLQVSSISANDVGNSVRVAAVQRELDEYLQKQMRVESAGGAYADPIPARRARSNPCSRTSPIRSRPW